MKIVRQVTHKKCGGEILVVLDEKEIKFVCSSCRCLWGLGTYFRAYKPNNWVAVKTASEDELNNQKRQI